MDILTNTVGDLLFGRSLRLEVARWIVQRDEPRFYQSELTAELPERFRSSVPDELGRLAEAGMLHEEVREDGQRRRYYRRTDSPLWRVVTEAILAIQSIDATDVGDSDGTANQAEVAKQKLQATHNVA